MLSTQTTEEQEIMLAEEEFYNNPFQFSYNSLRKLLENPKKFYKEYVLGKREKLYGNYLIEGGLIHFLILEHNDVQIEDRYAIMTDNLPSDNAMAIIDTIFDNNPEKETLDECLQEIDEQLSERNLYQTIKDFDKRVGKICDEKGRQYFEFLKNKEGKIIVDMNTLARCMKRAEEIKKNHELMHLIGQEDVQNGWAVYNEHEFSIDNIKNYEFGLKGILDNMVVDTEKKTVYINDFKTTSRNIQDFPESVKNHKYSLQAAIYCVLAKKCMKLSDDWKIEFSFIVIDKDDTTYRFRVSDNTMNLWLNELAHALHNADFHISNRNFNLPYEFENNLVVL